MTRTQIYRLFEVSSVLLLLIQALKVMFSVLFGIIYDGVFEGPFTTWLVISVVLLLLAFLSPMLVARRLQLRHLSILAVVSATARIAMCINVAEIRYWGALITILAAVLYLAVFLRTQRDYARIGFIIALCLDQLFRIMGYTYDISLRMWWLPIQSLWMLLLLFTGIRLMKEVEGGEATGVNFGFRNGLVLGGFLFLQTSLLSMPNAIARWSNVDYEWIAPLLLLLTLAFLHPLISSRILSFLGTRVWIRLASAVFLPLGLMVGYFSTGFLAAACLLLVHVSSIGLLVYSLEGGKFVRPKGGFPVTGALVLFLLLNFLNAFAFTYPYTLPALREMGWVVYLSAGVFLGLAIFTKATVEVKQWITLSSKAFVPILGAMLVAAIFLWPIQTSDLSDSGTLRVATYNIHYGFDDDWHYTLDQIAMTIEENDCDVVAMQEVDTGRMTSYLVDNAYYLARTLKMQVAYLPTVEHLTGIGILYRGPKLMEEVQLISSLQEQTGIIGLALGEPGNLFHAYGIWMGLSKEDTERQISEALDFIGEHSPATFGGDFNADPESQVAEAIREAGFMDPFTSLGKDPAPNTSPAIQPQRRIDFVWVRELTATNAWVPESLASDHRMVVVEVSYLP